MGPDGTGLDLGEFILYMFEFVANLIVRKDFLKKCIWVYVYRIYVWVCDFCVLFLMISVFGFVILKGKMRNLKVKYCRFM